MPGPESPFPVDPSDTAPAARGRMVLFTAVGALLVGALFFAVITRVVGTNATAPVASVDSSGNRVARFELGRAADYAKTIARDGPILFPDPKAKSRDIFIQHLGGADWLAFEARAAGAPRQCVLNWERDARRFVDPCDGRAYPADGAGLVSFPTVVNDKGRVVVDLSTPTNPTTTQTTTATTTPTTLAY